MLYRTFQGEKLSLLGFGTMRLPTLPSGEVDEQTTSEMVKLALDSGVNYFDTAYPYHSGASERVIGRALADYPRESFYLATKYPGHQVKQSYDPAAVFEEQLKKCGVGERTPPPASRAPPLSGEAFGVAAPPLKGFTRKARTSPAAPSLL